MKKRFALLMSLTFFCGSIFSLAPDTLRTNVHQDREDTLFNPLNLDLLKKEYFVQIPGGSFLRGSAEGQGDEQPVKEVVLDTFYIGRFEVTQGDWEKLMGQNPSSVKGANFPVDNVSWDQIQEFLKKLNVLNPLSLHYFRLPTEAEWEYAARGGKNSRGTIFSGSDDMDSVAWHRDNSNHSLRPVGTKMANELGIHDMTGNVWEFVNDWYDPKYYNTSPDRDPKGPETGEFKVMRGGGAFDNYYMSKVFIRSSKRPNFPNPYIGFRLVKANILQ